MRQLLLAVRADANRAIGSGHAVRCLAVADAWSKHDKVILVAQDLDESLVRRWLAHGHEVLISPNPAQALVDCSPDAILVDGYHIPASEQEVYGGTAPTLLVDDHGLTGIHGAWGVIDGNLEPGTYAGQALLGPKYALLGPGFGPGTGSGTLLTFGANAPPNLIREALRGAGSGTLVLGGMQVEAEDLAAEARRRGFHVERDVDEMAALMQRHAVAISAAGSTVLELAACGIPALVVVIAENQAPVAKAAEGLGLVTVAEETNFEESVRTYLAAPRKKTPRAIVDGRGANRACAWLRSQCIDVRAAQLEDAGLVLEWANDLNTRAMSYNNQLISATEHESWWSARMVDSTMFIGLAPQPFGFIWFKRRKKEAVISVNLAPSARGRGLGPALIIKATRQFRLDYPNVAVVAVVRYGNEASRRAFLDAGYDPAQAHQDFPGAWTFRFA